MYKATTRFGFGIGPVVWFRGEHAGLICLVSLSGLSACTSNLAQLPHTPFAQIRSIVPTVLPTAASDGVPFSKDLALPTIAAVQAEVGTFEDNATASTVGIPVELAGAVSLDDISSAKQVDNALNEPEMNVDAVDAPLVSLLYSLASEANAELRINGSLNTRVTVKAQQKTWPQILDLLAEQGGFSWQLDHQQLTVWSGEAYAYTYPVNYLNMDRLTRSSVGLATQVGSINAADSNNSTVANSSRTRVENTSEHRFWDSVENDLDGLLARSNIDINAGYTLNAEAGLLSLFGSPETHQVVKRYLSLLHASAQRQVLIEATVVEVTLSDSFEAGVDWQLLADGMSGLSAAQVLVGAPAITADSIGRIMAPAGLLSLVEQGGAGDVRATLSLLEQFGDVRILSRPRIIALNNQSSILKVVDNRVYFTVNVERRQTDSRDELVTETQIHTVPVGLVMNVTPQISEHGAVMLNVRPSLSRILGFVNDPNPELALANVRNGVPEIQVREMESMLQVQSGNLAIIGGLMQDTTQENDSRLPGLGRLPLIRHLFSQHARQRRQTELLIVLRPTVLDSASQVALR